jgi:hypothetical protein
MAMSRAVIPSRILRRQLLERPRNGAVQQLNGRRCYAADTKNEEKESFKGQLYQSTAERLQRDKAEQARFAGHREAQKARSSPPWLVPFGMSMRGVMILAKSCKALLELTSFSSDRRRNWRLLLRQADPQQSRYSFDQAFVADRRAQPRCITGDTTSSMDGIQEHLGRGKRFDAAGRAQVAFGK